MDDPSSTHVPDPLQEALIRRMKAAGTNPNQVAEQLAGKVSRSHVCDYLTRRKSMGSHKVWHLIALLAPDVWALMASHSAPPGSKTDGARQ